jgi:hypothetical protein
VLEAGTDASYLMLTALGGLAEFERDLSCARMSEGREQAKARGAKLGRKPKQTEHQRREAIRRRDCRRRAAAKHRPQLHRVAQHDFPTARRANLSDDEAIISKGEEIMKMVRRAAMVMLLSALALLGSPFTAKPAQLGQTEQAALVQLEKQAWEVAKQKDWQAYNRLLSQDFVWIDDGGVLLGREPFLKYIADLDLTDYAMEGAKVTLFSNNVAMLTYKVVSHGKFAGQTIPPTPFYVGSEYLRRAGRWVNVFTQMTTAKQ